MECLVVLKCLSWNSETRVQDLGMANIQRGFVLRDDGDDDAIKDRWISRAMLRLWHTQPWLEDGDGLEGLVSSRGYTNVSSLHD